MLHRGVLKHLADTFLKFPTSTLVAYRSLIFPTTVTKKVFVLLIAMCCLANAQWHGNVVVLCDTSGDVSATMLPQIATDDAGGAFVCWQDNRNRHDYDVYAQYVDSSGKVKWQKDGIPIAALPAGQGYPRITEDGNGGAFIAWEDSRIYVDTYVYAQRVNKNGQFLWPNSGIKASDQDGLFISIHNDGKGGLFLGWVSGGIYNTYLQRLDSLGNRMWGDSGVQVTNRSGIIYPNGVSVTTDGAGGAIVAGAEGSDNDHQNMYVQRVDSSGKPLWQANGILLNDTTIHNGGPVITSDNNGGAIIEWADRTRNARVQRVNGSGNILWQQNGIELPVLNLNSAGGLGNTPDKYGGAIVGIRLRRHLIDPSGNKIWGDTGVAYSTNPNTLSSSQVSDGNGGVLIFAESQTNKGQLIAAQWIDKNGKIRFGKDGAQLAPYAVLPHQVFPGAVSDGKGGAVICWGEGDSQLVGSIYATRIDTSSFVTSVRSSRSVIPQEMQLYQNYPNPFNPSTTIEYVLPITAFVLVKVYDVLGREVATLVKERQVAGYHSIKFESNSIPSGAYFYEILTGNASHVKKMIIVR